LESAFGVKLGEFIFRAIHADSGGAIALGDDGVCPIFQIPVHIADLSAIDTNSRNRNPSVEPIPSFHMMAPIRSKDGGVTTSTVLVGPSFPDALVKFHRLTFGRASEKSRFAGILSLKLKKAPESGLAWGINDFRGLEQETGGANGGGPRRLSRLKI